MGPAFVLYTPGLYTDMAGLGAGDQIQGLVHARHVFYLEATAPAMFFLDKTYIYPSWL